MSELKEQLNGSRHSTQRSAGNSRARRKEKAGEHQPVPVSGIYDVIDSSSDESHHGLLGSKSRKRKKGKAKVHLRPSAFRPEGLDTASPCPSSSEEDAPNRTKRDGRPAAKQSAMETGSISSIQTCSPENKRNKRRNTDDNFVWGRANIAKRASGLLGETPGRLTIVAKPRSAAGLY